MAPTRAPLFLLLLLSLPALAGEEASEDRREAAEPAAAQSATAEAPAMPFAGWRVWVDPATGTILPAPTEEMTEEMLGELARRAARPPAGSRADRELVPFRTPEGGVGVFVGDRFQRASWLERGTGARVTGSIGQDDDQLAGTDERGRVLMFSPRPLEPGSSISHFDTSASPNLLMEPSISRDLRPLDVDLTRDLLQDLGWPIGGGADLRLVFPDGPNEGFNDPLLGAQRRAAVRTAADVWASILSSPVPIRLSVAFDDLTCGDSGATLAQAGPRFVFKSPATTFPGSWYPGALAEAISGQNLSLADDANPEAADGSVTFNEQIDRDCLGNGAVFHYGSDTAPGNRLSFLSTALHEMAHALGFTSLVDERTGETFMGAPDVYIHFLRDNVLGRIWANMTADQRRASAIRPGQVAWTGANTRRRAARLLVGRPVFALETPGSVAEEFAVGTASFGRPFDAGTVRGELGIVQDRVGTSEDGCEPVSNRAGVRDRIVLVTRGNCNFTVKAQHAEAAGAIGVVVVNNVPGTVQMGGVDPGIGIPVVSVDQADGARIQQIIRNPPGGGDPGDDPGDDPEEPGDDPEEGTVEDLPDEQPGPCVATQSAVCLAGDRFRIEIDFATTDDQTTRAAVAEELSGDTATFWFFSPANLEILVKVLDACGFAGRFWVFAGGLTDVEVALRVVDTATGKGRLYRNPPGTPFQPIQDTGAFATCP